MNSIACYQVELRKHTQFIKESILGKSVRDEKCLDLFQLQSDFVHCFKWAFVSMYSGLMSSFSPEVYREMKKARLLCNIKCTVLFLASMHYKTF